MTLARPEITAYIGIGSNLGDRCSMAKQVFNSLATLPETKLTGQSDLFCSAPLEADGGDYINAVAQIRTRLPALTLLQYLQAIELANGRVRPYLNAPRALDLDILLYGNQMISTEALSVPHPRLTERAFALIPMLQIDPLITIPGHGPGHGFLPGVASQSIRKYR